MKENLLPQAIRFAAVAIAMVGTINLLAGIEQPTAGSLAFFFGGWCLVIGINIYLNNLRNGAL